MDIQSHDVYMQIFGYIEDSNAFQVSITTFCMSVVILISLVEMK